MIKFQVNEHIAQLFWIGLKMTYIIFIFYIILYKNNKKKTNVFYENYIFGELKKKSS